MNDEGDDSVNANVKATFSSDASEGTMIVPQDLILYVHLPLERL